MNNPAVSILVPICNVERYLRECLDSLVYQTLRDIEIICIDDGSTDSSLDIIREYERKDSRVTVLTKPNSGYGDSMNKGLKMARGEFIGIVESDDFASLDMFQSLYDLATSNGVDLVRSNYYAHCGENEDDDYLVDNLFGCVTGRVISPMECKHVFMRQPAIWTGLYRKDYLVENDVWFLPTPGASFQDTAFYFKSLYSADKIYLTSEGYLHYRIDNAGSSVKNQNKIFPICDEYSEIWDYAHRDAGKFDQLKDWIPRQQFEGYTWNLNRLAPDIQPLFFERFAKEFKQIKDVHLLRQDLFEGDTWTRVNQIADDPAGYYKMAYGASDISASTFLCLGSIGYGQAKIIVESLVEECPFDEELIVFHSESDRMVAELRREHINVGALRSDGDFSLCHAIGLIDPCGIRGGLVRFVGVTDAANVSDIVGLFTSDEARSKRLVVSSEAGISLSFARDELWTDSCGHCSLPYSAVTSLIREGRHNSIDIDSDYGQLWCASDFPDRSFKFAATQVKEWATDLFSSGLCYRDAKIAYGALLGIWSKVRVAYTNLPWPLHEECRALFESMSQVPGLEYSFDSDRSTRLLAPKVSIIVPVYNALPYLDECLSSILDQTIDDAEIILINDGSCDDSLCSMEAYADKYSNIRVISEFNCGAGAARNRGISLARAGRLCFIDPDDRYCTNHALQDLYDAMDRSGSLMCGGSFNILEPDGKITSDFDFSQSYYHVSEERIVVPSEVWSDYGWIRFMYDSELFKAGDLAFPQLNWYEDPVFFINAISRAGGYYEIPSDIYLYRVGHKQTEWTLARTRDLLTGIYRNMCTAIEFRMFELCPTLLERLDTEYFEAIAANYSDEGIFLQLFEIQSVLFNNSGFMLPGYSDSLHRLQILKNVGGIDKAPVLVERMATRIARSGVYHRIQKIIERIKK